MRLPEHETSEAGKKNVLLEGARTLSKLELRCNNFRSELKVILDQIAQGEYNRVKNYMNELHREIDAQQHAEEAARQQRLRKAKFSAQQEAKKRGTSLAVAAVPEEAEKEDAAVKEGTVPATSSNAVSSEHRNSVGDASGAPATLSHAEKLEEMEKANPLKAWDVDEKVNEIMGPFVTGLLDECFELYEVNQKLLRMAARFRDGYHSKQNEIIQLENTLADMQMLLESKDLQIRRLKDGDTASSHEVSPGMFGGHDR